MTSALPIALEPWIQSYVTRSEPIAHHILGADGDWTIVLRVGAESRVDYHENDTDEWYHQIQGDLTLRLFAQGQYRDVLVREGESYCVLPGVAHAAQRRDDSVGFVLERKRNRDEIDSVFFLCTQCRSELYRETFRLQEPADDFVSIVERFYGLDTNCTCLGCDLTMKTSA